MSAPASKSPGGTWRRPAAWLWVKVALCLVLVDFVLFRVGLLWTVAPNFGRGLGAENWLFLFRAAQQVETRGARPPASVLVGSSVTIMGVDAASVNARLHRDRVAQDFLHFATHGSLCTDSALLATSAMAFRPWLVIYGAARRDFPKSGTGDSSVVRTFYDSSVELPWLPRHGAEAVLDAEVKHYWKLYRYRFFVRTALTTEAAAMVDKLGFALPSFAAGVPGKPLPPDAVRYFSPYRVTYQSFAAWDQWRRSRRFSDYVAWMHYSSLALANYKTQTLANFGPGGNQQVEALRWMLASLQQHHTRTIVLYFPENPVFRDPEATQYFDPTLSQTYAELLQREAAAHGARFEDLRNFLAPEDFYDLVHANLEGQRKLSARIGDIVEEEWRRHVDEEWRAEVEHRGGQGTRSLP